MNEETKPFGRAVVIGASISGLTMARVLARHFQQVTVIERDVQPPLGVARKSVPQGRHLHVLLARGCQLLEGFFPGLLQEMVAHGAVAGDLAESVIWYSGGAYTRNFRSGLISMQVTRPLLEGAIYRRVCALPNVTMLENHDAVGLVSQAANGSGVRITGVRVTDRSKSEPVEKTLPADLVIDAGGRGSRCVTWLEGLGFERPAEETIKMGLSYTTRVFRRLPEHAGGRSPVVVMNSYNNRRAGIMLAVEGERWIAGLSGFLGESAPTDLPGFIEYARTLDAPDVYNILKFAEPIGEAATYKYPSSQRRYYERLKRFPEGLVVCGDALCSFNPIYVQGMTTAASEADALEDCLRQGGLPGLGKRFFQRASRLVDSPWSISAGSDLAYPEVEGKRTPAMQLVGKYLERLLLASRTDAVLNLAFQRVTNLMDPPSALFRPKIVARVLRGGRT